MKGIPSDQKFPLYKAIKSDVVCHLAFQETNHNLVPYDELNRNKCASPVAKQSNLNRASFTFDNLPDGTPFSMAIYAENSKVRLENISHEIYLHMKGAGSRNSDA